MTHTLSSSPPAPRRITPQTLKQWIHDDGELAILDVREEGAFSRKHLLLAGNAPLWRLELFIRKLVPNFGTRIVLADLDGSLLARAAGKLAALGYTNLAVLDGGTLAWERAGHQVFSGINLLSKAYGEVIEAQLGTPHIEVEELRRRLARGDDIVVVDGRTPEEYRRFSIPGAHSLPNAELLYRIGEVAPRAETLVVVNCAGRTRSILGAQTLISARIGNPVVALKDGTMAWLQKGYALANGVAPALPEPSPATRDRAALLAGEVARKAGVRHLSREELSALQAESGTHTLYLFDVRTKQEYEQGHLPGWRWAPGGQLVQATDQYIGVRHARVVLADWEGVRAQTTAAWLAQLGLFDVYLHAVTQTELDTGPEPGRLASTGEPSSEAVSASVLSQWHAESRAAIYDVESSLAFAVRHIEGARFSAPDRLPGFAAGQPADKPVVITSSDGLLARLAASELRNHHGIDARYLSGGNAAWFDLGLPTANGRADILTDDDDDWYSPYLYPTEEQRLEKMREYLAWEVALGEQIDRDGDVRIRLA